MLKTISQGRGLEASFVSLCVLIVMMLGVIFTNVYGPVIESRLFPVISEFKVVEISPVNTKEMILRGSFVKLRAECKLDSLVAYTVDRQNILKVPAKIEFLDIDAGEVTFRITGRQSWGPWRLSSDAGLSGTTLNITSYHQCHGLYLVPTTLISIPINYNLNKPPTSLAK